MILILKKILCYLLLVFVVTGILSQPIWHIIQSAPPEMLWGSIAQLQAYPFYRYISRILEITSILFLWPFFRNFYIADSTRLFSKEHTISDIVTEVVTGIIAGIFSVCCLIGFCLISSVFVIKNTHFSVVVFLKFAMIGCIVSFIEEIIFRSILMQSLIKYCLNSSHFFSKNRIIIANLMTAFLFASIHFINFSHQISNQQIHFFTGFNILSSCFIESYHSFSLWAWLTLFFVSLILGTIFLCNHSLCIIIPIHAIWIAFLKYFNSSVEYHQSFLPWASSFECHGAVPTGLVAILSLIVAIIIVFAPCWMKKFFFGNMNFIYPKKLTFFSSW